MESKLPEELSSSILSDQAAAAMTQPSDDTAGTAASGNVNAAQMQRMQLAVADVVREFAKETIASMTAIVSDIPRVPLSPLIRQLQRKNRRSRSSQQQQQQQKEEEEVLENADVLPVPKRLRTTQSTDVDDDAIVVPQTRPVGQASAGSASSSVPSHSVASAAAPARATSAATAATAAAAAPPQFQFVSDSVAAQRTGLPKAIIKSWATQGLIDSLKPGSDASHRLIDIIDLARFVELKRERASSEVRLQIKQEQKMLTRRTLVLVREAPPIESDVEMSEDDLKLYSQPLWAKARQMAELLRIDPAICTFELDLDADNTDPERVGFAQRKISCLVMSDREQVCTLAVWPLFEWLCKHHDVAIILAPLPPAAGRAT
jgi:hypothetical protein